MSKRFFSIDQFKHVHDVHDLHLGPAVTFSKLPFYLLQKPVLGIITSFVMRHICEVHAKNV